MIRFIIIIILLLSALALGPLLLDEKGYILISLGNSIYELSVYAAIFWFMAVLIVSFFSYKIFRGGLKLTFGSWNKIVFAGQRRGIVNFNKGLAAFMLEDYKQAEQLFSKSAVPSKRKQSAYLLAAAASAKQDLDSNTNHYLTLLEKETGQVKDLGLESVIVKIKLLMNQNKAETYTKARTLINDNHKQIGHDSRLLALEIDLCLIEHRFEAVVNYLNSARKDNTHTDSRIRAWESQAYYGVFNDLICQHDQVKLTAYWQSLSKKLKHREAILFAYCQVLAEQNIAQPLNKLLLPILKKSPSSEFLKQLRKLPIKQADDLIMQVQKHLHKDIHSGKWLSCLGHLALASNQYSMAEKSFASLVKLEQENFGIQYDLQDLQAFAKAHSAQGQHQSANDVWLKASEM